MKKTSINKKVRIALSAIIALVIIMAIGMAIYVNDYYHAEPEAVAIVEHYENEVTGFDIEKYDNDKIIGFIPENPTAGLVFYPGGKVQMEAYAPLMSKCAEKGIACVLVKMPGNLAVFNPNAFSNALKYFSNSDIETWYIGGHSLGGVMASSYASKHSDEIEGIILLASYTTEDISSSNLKVLSLRGSEDKVLNLESYEDNKSNLPEKAKEVIIEGGCHAYFGCYGEQDGDGDATITNEEQINITVDEICVFINNCCMEICKFC